MSTSPAQTFLNTLEAEPWYQSVAQTFMAASIAPELWEATLAIEDTSLNPAETYVEKDGSTSYGLFQLNSNGVGAGIATSTLEDPVLNAQIAARKMAAQIASEGTGSQSLANQLQTIERAGWNGSLEEDVPRQKALANILAAEDKPYVQPTNKTYPAGVTGAIEQAEDQTAAAATSIGNAVQNGLTINGLPTPTQINTWLQQGLIGAILLGVLAGGFALLAAPQIQDAEKVAPLVA